MACLVVCDVGVLRTDQHWPSPGYAPVGRASSRSGVEPDGCRRRHGSAVDHFPTVCRRHRRSGFRRHRHPCSVRL